MQIYVLEMVTALQLLYINWEVWKISLGAFHGCDFLMYQYDCMKQYSMDTAIFVKCDYESGATD